MVYSKYRVPAFCSTNFREIAPVGQSWFSAPVSRASYFVGK